VGERIKQKEKNQKKETGVLATLKIPQTTKCVDKKLAPKEVFDLSLFQLWVDRQAEGKVRVHKDTYWSFRQHRDRA